MATRKRRVSRGSEGGEMDELAEFKRTFFQECEELLGSLETQLTAIEEGQAEPEILHAAFRAIHSIKGGAGAFGFDGLVAFAHVFETVLDLIRSGRLATDHATAALLIRAADVLADLVGAAQHGTRLPADFGRDVRDALDELAGTGGSGREPDGLDFVPVRAADAPLPEAAAGTPPAAPRRTVTISFAPASDMFRRANEPLLLIRELKGLGSLRAQVALDRLPPLEELEPEGAYLAWTFELQTAEPLAMVEEVFEFVLDDCTLAIEEPGPGGEVAVDGGAAAAGGSDPVLSAPAEPAPAVPAGDAPPPAPPPPARADKPGSESKMPATIRVDLEKVDRLVNMVGELVITQAMLSQQATVLAGDHHAGLIHGIETLALRSRELQETVMAIRAQPVKSVFSRMSRLVRELSAALGKEARLVITGEHTEVDKTVIEELADPLTHMIRNSMDHGIESPEQRLAAGKPREGVIHLSAEHRSGRILISVGDDGQGINRAKVLDKAIRKGLVPADVQPSDEEIDNLLFLPGFSTADQVSSVSGRGVGMDVVKRNIQGMGGRVGISSSPGRGSRFMLTLPLTLAVLDGMIVKVGVESYVVPITSIVETLRPTAGRLHRLASGGQVIADRGGFIRLVHLDRIFGLAGAVGDASQGLVVVVEIEDGSRIGLVVDELLGQQQVVIKSLEANYRRVDGVSSATILGNGMVALILDVDRLAVMSHPTETRTARPVPARLEEGACQ